MGDEVQLRRQSWKIALSLFVVVTVTSAVVSRVSGTSLPAAIIGGLIAAAIFVSLFVWLNRWLTSKMRAKHGLHGPETGPVVTEELRVSSSPAEVVRTVLTTAGSMPRAKVTRSDANEVHIRVGLSVRSWGEHLHVQVTPQETDTLVSVTSRPLLATTVFDYGKGEENVRHIVNGLRGRSPLT